jgi:hypothetical protein
MPHTGGSAPRVLESRTSARGATRTTGIVKSNPLIYTNYGKEKQKTTAEPFS